MNVETETPEALADPIGASAAGEGQAPTEEGTASEGFDRVTVARRMATLRQRGIEIDEWVAEEFTNIERQLQQLRDARLRGKQPIVWFQTARDVMDAFDRGLLKDKNEARSMFGLKPLKKRAQPAQLARAQATRRRS